MAVLANAESDEESDALRLLRLGPKNAPHFCLVLGAKLPSCEEAKAPAEVPADSQHHPPGTGVSLQMIPAPSHQASHPSQPLSLPVDATFDSERLLPTHHAMCKVQVPEWD